MAIPPNFVYLTTPLSAPGGATIRVRVSTEYVAIDIADKRLEAKKGQAHPDEVRKLNAEFQRQARKDKEDYPNRACKEMEDENGKGKTRYLLKKIREVTGKFKPRIGGLKSKSGNTLVKKDLWSKDGDTIQKTYMNEMATWQLNIRQRNVMKKQLY